MSAQDTAADQLNEQGVAEARHATVLKHKYVPAITDSSRSPPAAWSGPRHRRANPGQLPCPLAEANAALPA